MEGMTINSNTGLPIGFILEPNDPPTTGGSPDKIAGPTPPTVASSSSISPTASFLSQLDQLQQQSPAQYSNVASSIAAQLKADATAAQSNGNTAQAKTLTQLATEFQNSAQSGQVPSAQVLQQALAGHHGHHHGHHPEAASSASNTQTASTSTSGSGSVQSLLATAFSNAMSSIAA
jgi:predicted restriction endonuclease